MDNTNRSVYNKLIYENLKQLFLNHFKKEIQSHLNKVQCYNKIPVQIEEIEKSKVLEHYYSIKNHKIKIMTSLFCNRYLFKIKKKSFTIRKVVKSNLKV